VEESGRHARRDSRYGGTMPRTSTGEENLSIHLSQQGRMGARGHALRVAGRAVALSRRGGSRAGRIHAGGPGLGGWGLPAGH
jgi:hypothetical protein